MSGDSQCPTAKGCAEADSKLARNGRRNEERIHSSKPRYQREKQDVLIAGRRFNNDATHAALQEDVGCPDALAMPHLLGMKAQGMRMDRGGNGNR